MTGWQGFLLGLGLGLALAVPALAAPVEAPQILVMLKVAPPHFRNNASYAGDYGDPQSNAGLLRAARRIGRAHGLTLVTSWPMPLLQVDCLVMAGPADQSPAALAALVMQDPAVAWAEPMYQYRGLDGRGDPLFATQPTARAWRLSDLHAVADGRGVKVAVIDSGVDTDHPDLARQIATAQNFVAASPYAAELHGTAVAGIIAAKGDNGIGIVGVAPGARLMALRACWQKPPDTVCDSLSLAKALHFAIDHNAEVINLSLSGPRGLLLQKLIVLGLERGATVIAAVDPQRSDGGFPAALAGVMAVSDNVVAVAPPDVYTAPGRDVPTTVPGGRWSLVSGNSYAAAQVSGLMALRRQNVRARGRIAPVAVKAGDGAIDACRTVLGEGRCNGAGHFEAGRGR